MPRFTTVLFSADRIVVWPRTANSILSLHSGTIVAYSCPHLHDRTDVKASPSIEREPLQMSLVIAQHPEVSDTLFYRQTQLEFHPRDFRRVTWLNTLTILHPRRLLPV